MKVVLCIAPIMDYIDNKLRTIAQDLTPSCPTLGIYLLAGYLRRDGYEVTVIDLTAEGTDRIDDWLPKIQEAGLVGISATSLNWPTVVSVVKQIAIAASGIPIVVGGIHPTMFPDYIMRSFPIDFVIRYEGEKPLVMLCRALQGHLEYAEVPNLSWRRRDGEIVHNPATSMMPVAELASSPLPAYDLLPNKVYPMLSLQSSRGCSFNCSFCSTQFRHSYRALPPSLFVDKLQGIHSLAGDRVLVPTVFQIVDDEWSLDRKRSIAILREMDRRDLPWKFIFDSRANDFLALSSPDETESYIDAVALHIERFLVGAECGYDEGLRKIGKGTTVAKIEACAKLLAKYGVANRCELSFILGLPWEGKEEVLKTVQFASQLALQYGVTTLLQWYCQIPGSMIWDQSWRRGDVSPAMYDDFGFFRNLYLFTSGVQLSPEEIWEVMDVIYTTHSLLVLSGRPKGTMAYRPPAPIELNFPRSLYEGQEKKGVAPGAQLVWTQSMRQKVGEAK